MKAMPACALALFLLACGGTRESPRADERVLLLLPVGAGADADVPADVTAVARVEIAVDSLARERGLMERDALLPDTGMLFVYPDERAREFWMKNTWIPLSIAYATRDGRIVRILEMSPGVGIPDDELRRYPSGEPATMAVEMDAGWFADHGIRTGDRIRLDPFLGGIEAR